jgi:hypothetical protein
MPADEELIKTIEELKTMVYNMAEENAFLKQRVSVLEGHLDLDDFYKESLLEEGITPFCEHVKTLQEGSAKSEYDKQVTMLKVELSRRQVMKTKEVMAFFGFKHYEQAKRLMKKLELEDKNYKYENQHGKTFRIRQLNNVRTNIVLNNVYAQD